MYSRVPNITGVPNKSERGFFYPTLINKIGGDLISKKFQIKTCKREKHVKKNKIPSCFIRNSRVCSMYVFQNKTNLMQLNIRNSTWLQLSF